MDRKVDTTDRIVLETRTDYFWEAGHKPWRLTNAPNYTGGRHVYRHKTDETVS